MNRTPSQTKSISLLKPSHTYFLLINTTPLLSFSRKETQLDSLINGTLIYPELMIQSRTELFTTVWFKTPARALSATPVTVDHRTVSSAQTSQQQSWNSDNCLTFFSSHARGGWLWLQTISILLRVQATCRIRIHTCWFLLLWWLCLRPSHHRHATHYSPRDWRRRPTVEIGPWLASWPPNNILRTEYVCSTVGDIPSPPTDDGPAQYYSIVLTVLRQTNQANQSETRAGASFQPVSTFRSLRRRRRIYRWIMLLFSHGDDILVLSIGAGILMRLYCTYSKI